MAATMWVVFVDGGERNENKYASREMNVGRKEGRRTSHELRNLSRHCAVVVGGWNLAAVHTRQKVLYTYA